MLGSCDYFVRSATDWFFRRRSPALIVARIGLLLLLSLGGGWVVGVTIPWYEGQLAIDFTSAGGMSTIFSFTTLTLAVGSIIVGVLWEIMRYRKEQLRLSRQKVIVVEVRGLRDTSGTPLTEAVPRHLKGRRDQILVDLRQRVQDGLIIEPNAPVERISSFPAEIDQKVNGLDRRDISYVYGGLAPVPLTFLTGVLFDDEGIVTVLDWDRHAESWRMLDESDDGRRFAIVGLEEIQTGSAEVALVVSVSYRIDIGAVREKIGGLPLVEVVLKDGQPDCHWSEEKQQALGKQFFDTVHALGNAGVKHIHLFLAAQNSVVFRFGRLYDKRNLPEVSVYQYQQGSHPPYPWAVRMPVRGISKADVIRTNCH